MKLATLAVGTCAALAVAATAFDADARGRSGGGRSSKGTAGHHHHHSHGHSRVFFAGSFVAWPRPYYWPGYYAVPAVAPVVEYWYYCQEHAAYYPYVQECPGGWQPVLPTIPPPEG
jgi:hypothetical protein